MNERVIIRYDSYKYNTLEEAERVEAWLHKVDKSEYNTIEKYGNGFVVTNRYDPRCNDKVTPVKPGFTNYTGGSI